MTTYDYYIYEWLLMTTKHMNDNDNIWMTTYDLLRMPKAMYETLQTLYYKRQLCITHVHIYIYIYIYIEREIDR